MSANSWECQTSKWRRQGRSRRWWYHWGRGSTTFWKMGATSFLPPSPSFLSLFLLLFLPLPPLPFSPFSPSIPCSFHSTSLPIISSRPLLKAVTGLRERCKLPQWVLAESGRRTVLAEFRLQKKAIRVPDLPIRSRKFWHCILISLCSLSKVGGDQPTGPLRSGPHGCWARCSRKRVRHLKKRKKSSFWIFKKT